MKYTLTLIGTFIFCLVAIPLSVWASSNSLVVTPKISVGKEIQDNNEFIILTLTHPAGTEKKEIFFVCPKNNKQDSYGVPCGEWIEVMGLTEQVSFLNNFEKKDKVTIKYRVHTDKKILNAKSVTLRGKSVLRKATVSFSIKNEPQYGYENDKSTAYIMTSIVTGKNIGNIVSWELTTKCPKGVALMLGGKGDEQDSNICGKKFTYSDSSYLRLNEERNVLNAGAINSNKRKSHVQYTLTAYDARGKVVGRDTEKVNLDARRQTKSAKVPVTLKTVPFYGTSDDSQAYIYASIGASENNKKVTSWVLSMSCPSGVTLIIPSKDEGPGQNMCGKSLTYYSSHYFNVNNETSIVNAGAVNSNNSKSYVRYVLTAYDATGQIVGSDTQTVDLGPKR